MTDKNYNQISWNIWNHCGEKLNEWECGFVENMMNWKGEFTQAQKETIVKINRKYLAQR